MKKPVSRKKSKSAKHYTATSFPANIFNFSDYDGAKAFSAFVFCLALFFFLSVFIPRGKSWWDYIPFIGIITRTVFNYTVFIWRFLILAIAWCLLWLTFDSRGFAGYAMGTFAVLFGLFYISSPFDLAPDFLPVIGSIDDAVMGSLSILLGLKNWVNADIRRRSEQHILKLLNSGRRNSALEILLEERGIAEYKNLRSF